MYRTHKTKQTPSHPKSTKSNRDSIVVIPQTKGVEQVPATNSRNTFSQTPVCTRLSEVVAQVNMISDGNRQDRMDRQFLELHRDP